MFKIRKKSRKMNKIDFLTFGKNLDKNMKSIYDLAINLTKTSDFVQLKKLLNEGLSTIVGFKSIHFCGERFHGLAGYQENKIIKIIIEMGKFADFFIKSIINNLKFPVNILLDLYLNYHSHNLFDKIHKL